MRNRRAFVCGSALASELPFYTVCRPLLAIADATARKSVDYPIRILKSPIAAFQGKNYKALFTNGAQARAFCNVFISSCRDSLVIFYNF